MKIIYPILAATLLFASCGGDKKETPAEKVARLKKERSALDAELQKLEGAMPDTGRKATPVTITEVQPQSFNAFIEAQSQITGDENVNATPQMAGTVRSVSAVAGQRVSAGQVLATLDAAAVDQQIAAQDVQVNLAQTLYEKQQTLWKQNIGTQVQLLQAKANYDAAVKQRAALVAQRNMYRIVAPISGTVDEVSVKVGDAASPGQPGIRVVNFSKLKAQASLGQNYIGKVEAGDPVTILLPDINDSINTKLSYVSKSVDPVSRALNVEVRLGANNKLRPGMSARMRITNYESSNAITVPVSVIQKTAEGDMLYIVENGKAKSVIVTTGRTADGQVEILSGLKPGDKIISTGFEDLDNGEPVTVK